MVPELLSRFSCLRKTCVELRDMDDHWPFTHEVMSRKLTVISKFLGQVREVTKG